jgi:hypothetical protein
MLVNIYEYTRGHVSEDGNFQESAGSLKSAEHRTEMSISRIRIWLHIPILKCAIQNTYRATRTGGDVQLFSFYCCVFARIIQESIPSQPVATVSTITAPEFTANIHLQSLTCGLNGRAALSLLRNEVTLYKFKTFRQRTPCESFQPPLLEIEGNEKLKSLTSEVSLILCVPNCSGQPGNGMLIGRLFVQLFKGFSAVLRYL